MPYNVLWCLSDNRSAAARFWVEALKCFKVGIKIRKHSITEFYCLTEGRRCTALQEWDITKLCRDWQIGMHCRIHHTTTTVLRPFYRDHPGEPVPEETFCTFCCKGRSTEEDTPTIRLGATPSGPTIAHCRIQWHLNAEVSERTEEKYEKGSSVMAWTTWSCHRQFLLQRCTNGWLEPNLRMWGRVQGCLSPSNIGAIPPTRGSS